MKPWLSLLFLILLQTNPLAITSPQPGQIVQGVVTVTGTSDVPAFAYAELAFSYAVETPDTWFLIATMDQPVTEGILASWDTTSLSDGNYHLRLRVYLQDGTYLETFVMGLQVQNDPLTATLTPTSTLTPTVEIPVLRFPSPRPQTVGLATVPPAYPTPKPLPTNPAILAQHRVTTALGQGALLSLGLILLFVLILHFRRL